MDADYTIVAGDTKPTFPATIQYSDGSAVDLTDKSVAFQMRSMSAAAPVALVGTMNIINAPAGIVEYVPAAADTPTSGTYLAKFVVTFGSDTMSFPTDGYLWVEVQPSLVSEPQQLVTLGDLKQYLDIDHNDRAHDSKLTGLIEDVRPLIEARTGPLIPQTFDEMYDGGHSTISLSHRPHTGYGTSPILNVTSVSEYVGTTEYPLAQVANASLGSTYSYELNARIGRITRRTAGGNPGFFPDGTDTVHVVYEAGQTTVPRNVRRACLEAVRVNYQTTQAVGRGRRAAADDLDTGPPLSFFLPRRCLEMLGPTRKHGAIA